ncbi:uncharacterized protein BO96DRAFT_427891 [Aspergillus niger CBS 101883]|uniref:uncharacterized protein n=1 Tax=Aspergillus lacticoffeatus (strain CBS 101883) TaxID=1450533 RepID=UPI000D7EFDB6|nr:uncharacterized protein BO96DRAFT_427891 [Aspergillus niger CBS 101883]PYH50807.1 hypothetical protein BO96DRAFT_427891 [Aspergillus niger CBS 101883]
MRFVLSSANGSFFSTGLSWLAPYPTQLRQAKLYGNAGLFDSSIASATTPPIMMLKMMRMVLHVIADNEVGVQCPRKPPNPSERIRDASAFANTYLFWAKGK